MLKVVSHIIIWRMARKLAFSLRHLAAILDLVKMAIRVEHSLELGLLSPGFTQLQWLFQLICLTSLKFKLRPPYFDGLTILSTPFYLCIILFQIWYVAYVLLLDKGVKELVSYDRRN